MSKNDALDNALEILLEEEDPVIYDYETSGFTFITIDYTGGSYIIPIEMLIDEASTMLSLVGHTHSTLNINKKQQRIIYGQRCLLTK